MNDTMRKRSLKRTTAFLLALSMICSFSQAISAGAVLSDIGESLDNSESVLLDSDNINVLSEDSLDIMELNVDDFQEENEDEQSYDAVGRVDVTIGLALMIDNNIDFTLTLSNNDGYSQNGIISADNLTEGKFSFEELSDGEYTLTVTAPGFASFSQDITVAQKMP